MLAIIALRFLFARENRIRDEKQAAAISSGAESIADMSYATTFEDLTDKQNPQ